MNTTTSLEELTHRIESSLDSIRPYLEADGGNIKIMQVTNDHVVKLEFIGACGNCPMSTMTFKVGVEEAIRKAVPEISRIEVINMTSN
jgi:Fe-S cluster biogenesis protein NfuA